MKDIHLKFLYVQLALVLAIAACATINGPTGFTDPSFSDARPVQLDCEGTELTVRFETGRADLSWKDGEDVLDQKPAASGFWFVSSRNSLRGKQPDFTWKRGGQTSRNCRELG